MRRFTLSVGVIEPSSIVRSDGSSAKRPDLLVVRPVVVVAVDLLLEELPDPRIGVDRLPADVRRVRRGPLLELVEVRDDERGQELLPVADDDRAARRTATS